MRQTAAEILDFGEWLGAWYNPAFRFWKPGNGGRLRLALFEPDIPQNTGALLRLAACLGVAVDLIEPCDFLLDDRRLKRAALDYVALLSVCRHPSWAAFLEARARLSRLVLLTTKGDVTLYRFSFAPDDTILLGRESAGVPCAVHRAADARIVIPLQPPARSLNVALAGAMALAEALRQTGSFPEQ
jgi:tRNA (cytidine/uridine-2'-O-)-methyltransferase